MAKSNFFVTAVGLNLGLLALSALSYWYTKNNSQQEKESEKKSSAQNSSAENFNSEANPVCGICRKEVASHGIILLCNHQVHGNCFHQLETNGWKCPECEKSLN